MNTPAPQPDGSATPQQTIVVGAGLAGLTAAARLARAGRAVTVLERNPEVGGRARTDDLDGWLFNHGGHALYRDGIGHSILRELGVDPQGEPPPLDGAQLGLGDTTTALPLSALSLLRTKALGFGAKVQFAKLMAGIGRLDPGDFTAVTVDEWLSDLRPDAQAVIKALVRLSTYAAATDVMSADAAIVQLVQADKGVLYLDGGWVTMSDSLANVVRVNGGTIRCGVGVDRIRCDADGYEVRAGDDTLRASSVVVAAGGPELTARLLSVDPETLGQVGPPAQAAVLDLALDRVPARHRFVLGVDRPTYFSVHSPPAAMAPPGKAAAVAMRYLHPDDAGSADEHRASLEHVASLAGTGEPVRSRFLRRMTVTHTIPTAATGGLPGRPGVAVPDLPGAYIAGDWVGERGLLADASVASGDEAAAAILP